MPTLVFLFVAQNNKDITHIYHSVSRSQSHFWDMKLPHEEAIMTVSQFHLLFYQWHQQKVWRRAIFQDNPLILGQVLICPTVHRSCSGVAASLRWYVLTCCEAGDVKRQASSQGQVELRIVGGKPPCSRTAGCLLICARMNRRNTPHWHTTAGQNHYCACFCPNCQKKDSRKVEWGPDLKLASVNHLWDKAYRCTPPSSHHMANALRGGSPRRSSIISSVACCRVHTRTNILMRSIMSRLKKFTDIGSNFNFKHFFSL